MQTAIEKDIRQTGDYEFDLMQMLNRMWAGRKLIIAAGLTCMLLGFAGAKLMNQHRVEGVLIFGGSIPYKTKNIEKQDSEKQEIEEKKGIAPADFKWLSATYLSEDHFKAYIKEKKQEGSPAVQELLTLFNKKGGLEVSVAPLYKVSKQDLKDIVGVVKDGENTVIGMNLKYQSDSAEAAREQVQWLAEYVMDSLLYGDLLERNRNARQQLEIKRLQLVGVIQSERRLLETYKQRAADLQRIAGRFPSVSSKADRQVVSVTEETAQYLPPQTLMATNEVLISRANEKIQNARLEQARFDRLLKYYEAVMPLFQQTFSGKVLLAGFAKEERGLFDGTKQSDDVTLEVRNKIKIENQGMELLYLNKSRIVSMQTYQTARPMLFAGVALLFGLMLAAMFVLLQRPLKQQHS